MKCGVGVLSYNRPDHLRWWVKQVQDNTPEKDVTVHIANDNKERKGIAFRSNECIKELYNEGCDYIFLFNDDCAPIRSGWMNHFIEASQASGQQHFMYLHETPGVKLIEEIHLDPKGEETFKGSLMDVAINSYDNCNGCMLFFTREVVEKVGGFDPAYKIYGMEHASYSNRIHAAGLTPIGKYLCPAGASEYIYSLDIDHTKPEWHKKLKHKSSMPPSEALYHVSKAQEVYNKPTRIYFPL